jgi:hypothetical protein
MEKKRMYYFSRQNILLNNYEDSNSKKFYQNYDELNATDVLRRSNVSNLKTHNNHQNQNQTTIKI